MLLQSDQWPIQQMETRGKAEYLRTFSLENWKRLSKKSKEGKPLKIAKNVH